MWGSEGSISMYTHTHTHTYAVYQWQTSVKSIWLTASGSSEIRRNRVPIICPWQAQVSSNQLHWHVFWVNSRGPSGWWEADYEVRNGGKHKAATGRADKDSHCPLFQPLSCLQWPLRPVHLERDTGLGHPASTGDLHWKQTYFSLFIVCFYNKQSNSEDPTGLSVPMWSLQREFPHL